MIIVVFVFSAKTFQLNGRPVREVNAVARSCRTNDVLIVSMMVNAVLVTLIMIGFSPMIDRRFVCVLFYCKHFWRMLLRIFECHMFVNVDGSSACLKTVHYCSSSRISARKVQFICRLITCSCFLGIFSGLCQVRC